MPPKKEAPPAKDHFPDVMIFLFLLAFLVAAGYRVEEYFVHNSFTSLWARFVIFFLHRVWPIIKILAAVASVAAFAGVVVFMRKLRAIEAEDALIYHDGEDKETVDLESAKNDKWERVVVHINSINPSDWRLAIIEADVILDDVLRKCGYHGDSIGDMLKAVEKSDLLTLDAAWEAHKVRNRVAHDGADYNLTGRDAKYTVSLYESVFKELKII